MLDKALLERYRKQNPKKYEAKFGYLDKVEVPENKAPEVTEAPQSEVIEEVAPEPKKRGRKPKA